MQFVHTNSSAENYLALKSGRVDAAIFGPPFDVQAQQEGFRLLVEGMKNPQPFPATCYFATAGFLSKRPEAARRFVEAMKESVQLFHEDKATAIKIIERRLRCKTAQCSSGPMSSSGCLCAAICRCNTMLSTTP